MRCLSRMANFPFFECSVGAAAAGWVVGLGCAVPCWRFSGCQHTSSDASAVVCMLCLQDELCGQRRTDTITARAACAVCDGGVYTMPINSNSRFVYLNNCFISTNAVKQAYRTSLLEDLDATLDSAACATLFAGVTRLSAVSQKSAVSSPATHVCCKNSNSTPQIQTFAGSFGGVDKHRFGGGSC